HIGAHYLLQTRTAVLNDELHEHFSRWFPGFNIKKSERCACGDAENGIIFVKMTPHNFTLSPIWGILTLAAKTQVF
ncbi:MAG: hypothetical protein ABI597_12290, partial [Gammaproteobacteria bacterium]